MVLADFRREYQLTSQEVRALSFPDFMRLLQGLSDTSRFRPAWRAAPKTLHDPADRAAVIAAARR